MAKIPTIGELFNDYRYFVQPEDGDPISVIDNEDFTKAMRSFAKMHVEAALKEASEEALLSRTDSMIGGCPECYVDGVDKESILNSYSLDNIK